MLSKNILGPSLIFSASATTPIRRPLLSAFQMQESYIHSHSSRMEDPAAAEEDTTRKQICALNQPFKDCKAILGAHDCDFLAVFHAIVRR